MSLVIFDCDGVLVDSERYGVQAARAAGMDVLAYAGGLKPRATSTCCCLPRQLSSKGRRP